MPIQRIRMLSFEGPNIASPRPGVLLHARTPRDISAALRNGLRDGVQRAGLTIAQLEIICAPAAGDRALQVWFETPTPLLGAALLQHLLDGLDTHETGNEQWDEDEQMALLQERATAQRMPIGVLQAMAEASARGIPTFQHTDGRIQFGYGGRGYTLAVEELAQGFDQRAPWAEAGRIPIVAICGGADLARSAARDLEAHGRHVACATAASFSQCQALLATPHAEIAIIDLAPDDMLARGLAFAGCTLAALVSAPEKLASALDDDEPLRAAALPLLVAQRGLINARIPQIAKIAPFLPQTVAAAPSAAALEEELRSITQTFGSYSASSSSSAP